MRSVLIVNANDPKALLNAPIYGADAVVFDLTKTDEADHDIARILLQEAIQFFDYTSIKVLIKVNALNTADGVLDMKALGSNPSCAFVVACSGSDVVKLADSLAQEIESGAGVTPFRIIPEVKGEISADALRELLQASPRISAILLPAEMSVLVSVCADMGVPAIAVSPMSARDAKTIGFSAVATENGGEVDEINEVYTTSRCEI